MNGRWDIGCIPDLSLLDIPYPGDPLSPLTYPRVRGYGMDRSDGWEGYRLVYRLEIPVAIRNIEVPIPVQT